MDKHTPVLLNEVLNNFREIQNSKEEVFAIDCTLGQAGHSIELFQRMNKGVLISIDLDRKTIEWVLSFLNDSDYDLEISEHEFNGNTVHEILVRSKAIVKKWYILKYNFSKIYELLDIFKIPAFDFILADLGFSNYQLVQNIGISFERPNQRLDMRYGDEEEDALNASVVLNTYPKDLLENIFNDLGQIENSKLLANEIVNKRKEHQFEKVSDILSILNKPKYPKSYKYKFFQALRSFVNSENERLAQLLKCMENILSPIGRGCVITFNSIEEGIVQSIWDDFDLIEPNITEIIKNKQSRSAKLYIYKKTRNKIQEKEE